MANLSFTRLFVRPVAKVTLISAKICKYHPLDQFSRVYNEPARRRWSLSIAQHPVHRLYRANEFSRRIWLGKETGGKIFRSTRGGTRSEKHSDISLSRVTGHIYATATTQTDIRKNQLHRRTFEPNERVWRIIDRGHHMKARIGKMQLVIECHKRFVFDNQYVAYDPLSFAKKHLLGIP